MAACTARSSAGHFLLRPESAFALIVQVPAATADSDGKIQIEMDGSIEVTKSFEMVCRPRCLTAGLYSGKLVVDTTFQEQEIMAAALSVVVSDTQTLIGAHVCAAPSAQRIGGILECTCVHGHCTSVL